MWPFLKFARSRAESQTEAKNNHQTWAAASDEEIAAHVRALVAAEFGPLMPQPISVVDEMRFADLDESMEYVELLMRCEEDFGLEIPDEDRRLERIVTVGDLCADIIERLRTL
jgi:acyl carrier protein